MHALGGTLYSRRVSWQDCVRACAQSVSCKSVDHVRGVDTCWMHTAATACGKLSVCDHCTNYQLEACGKWNLLPAGRVTAAGDVGRIIFSTISFFFFWLGGFFPQTNALFLEPRYWCGWAFPSLLFFFDLKKIKKCFGQNSRRNLWEFAAHKATTLTSLLYMQELFRSQRLRVASQQ